MAADGITYSNFQISPPKRRTADSSRGLDDELSRPQFLTLGAFTRTPKIHFERLQVGNSRSRTLVVRNPSTQDIWFRFLKMPSPVFQMSCGETSIIPAGDQLTITIKWSPIEVGRVFEPLRCQSGLSGVTLTVHLLGDAEPSNVWKTKSSKARSLLNCPARHPIKESTPKIEPSVAEKPFSMAKLQLDLNEPETSAAVSSPSRRETYLVPPTPHAIPLRPAAGDMAFSGIALNFDDEHDDFKENDCPPALPLATRQRLEEFEFSFDEPIGTDEFESEFFQSVSLSSAISEDGNGNNERNNLTPGLNNGVGVDTNLNFKGTADPEPGQISTMVTQPTRIIKSKFVNPDAEDLEGELLGKGFSQIDSLIGALRMKRVL